MQGTFWWSIPLTADPMMQNILSQIDPQDLLWDPIISKNRPVETDPHLTLLLNVPNPRTDTQALQRQSEVDWYLTSQPKRTLTFSQLGFFTNPPKMIEGQARSWDVLYIDPDPVSNQYLTQLHMDLKSRYQNVPQPRAEFNPHLTLCYLKFGTAQKYLDLFNPQQPLALKLDRFLFRKFRDHTVADVSVMCSGGTV